jgi:nitroreductase
MKFKDLVLETRTYRRFHQEQKISTEQLRELVDLARLSASPRNQQALKFMLIESEKHCEQLFPTLGWAAALPDWDGPEEGERPAAYIIILGDHSLIPKGKPHHHEAAYGIAAQSIMLGAAELGFGGCMIASIQRKPVREMFQISEHLEILLVLALGVPKEIVALEEMPEDGNFNYRRDENGVHFVPKRCLDELILLPPKILK